MPSHTLRCPEEKKRKVISLCQGAQLLFVTQHGIDKIINCVIITYAHGKCSNNEKYRKVRAG